MKLTKQEIESMEIPCNMVLIKLPSVYSDMLHNHYEYQLTKDVNIKVDTSFDPARHAPRFGLLVKSPKKLLYDKDRPSTMGWKCSVDTKEGDMVWFDYLACLTALGKLANPALPGEHPTWFRCENDIYIIIRYEALLFASRKVTDRSHPAYEHAPSKDAVFSEIICLNGQVIMRPIFKDMETQLIVPDHLKRKEEHLKCEVVFIGKANEEYLDGTIDSDGLEEGDVVVIKNYKITIDNSLGNLLEPGLVYVQQRHVSAILNR
jgi:co-chaperonin GroES (HSP10)